MSQAAEVCQPMGADQWEFELDETVVLLWLIDATGMVIGRSEFSRKDDQYLVEYPDNAGRLARTWVSGDAIDHTTTTTRN